MTWWEWAKGVHILMSFFQNFLRDLIIKRNPKGGLLEGTGNQWLCCPFLLPYGLRAILEEEKRRNALMGWAGKGPDSFIWFFWLLSHCTVSSKLQLPAGAAGRAPTSAVSGMSHTCTSAQQVHLWAFSDVWERKFFHILLNWFCITFWSTLLWTAWYGLVLTKYMCLACCPHILRFHSTYLLFRALKFLLVTDTSKTSCGDHGGLQYFWFTEHWWLMVGGAWVCLWKLQSVWCWFICWDSPEGTVMWLRSPGPGHGDAEPGQRTGGG